MYSEGAHTHVENNKADTGDATAGSRLATSRHSRSLPKKNPLMAEQQTPHHQEAITEKNKLTLVRPTTPRTKVGSVHKQHPQRMVTTKICGSRTTENHVTRIGTAWHSALEVDVQHSSGNHELSPCRYLCRRLIKNSERRRKRILSTSQL